MIKAVITPQGSATISATTSTASGNPTGNGNMVRVYNVGANTVFVAVGNTATVNDMPMPTGNIEYLAVAPGTAVSAITASSTATVYLTRCEVM